MGTQVKAFALQSKSHGNDVLGNIMHAGVRLHIDMPLTVDLNV